VLERTSRLRGVALILPALTAVLLGSVPSPAEPVAEPAVNLRKIAVTDHDASAPLLSSKGRATLTLEPKLQRAADRLLRLADPVAGAVILVHAPSGKTLVWSERKRGGAGPGAVLLDTQAPSASLFKLVTAAALLEKAGIPLHARVCTRGGKRSIEREHLEPPRRGEGVHCTPFADALGYSRNAVFAQLATRHLLRDDLARMAEAFCFNQASPFATGASLGTLKLPYNDLEFARAAAGFQASTLSPLGALNLAYTVAEGGRSVQIRIVERSGEYRAPARRRVRSRVVGPWTAKQLRRMMEVTVHRGTSLEAFADEDNKAYLSDIRVAGKTGTLRPSSQAPTTTWFIGFAPSRSPQVVISVLVQNAPVWRRKANELARDMLRVYFANRGYPGVTHPLP
jgi:peptidoglycan glycosyltransferase